jgi:hypothetical protein
MGMSRARCTRKLSFAIPKIPAGGSYCGGFDFIKIIPIRLTADVERG